MMSLEIVYFWSKLLVSNRGDSTKFLGFQNFVDSNWILSFVYGKLVDKFSRERMREELTTNIYKKMYLRESRELLINENVSRHITR